MDLTIIEILDRSLHRQVYSLKMLWKELLDEMQQASAFDVASAFPGLWAPLDDMLPETLCEEFDRIEGRLNDEQQLTVECLHWAWLIKTVAYTILEQQDPDFFHLDPAVMPSGLGPELNLPRPSIRAKSQKLYVSLSLDERAVLFNPPETD